MKRILSFGFLASIVALLIVISCKKSNNDAPDVSQFLNYTMNGTTVSFVPPGDTLTLSSLGGNRYTIWVRRKNPNNYEEVSLSFTATSTGTFPINYIHIFTNPKSYSELGTNNLNITEFGPVGEYISGNFTGNVRDTFPIPIPVNMIFRMKR